MQKFRLRRSRPSIAKCATKHLEFFASWSHIQFVSPQAWLLVVQEKIRLAHSISTHLLAPLLVFSIFINDSSITNGVGYMDAFLAHLAG